VSGQELEDLRRKRFESDYFILLGPSGEVVVTNRRALEAESFFQELARRLREYGISLNVEEHDPHKEDWP
jgi:hypothetical protein